MPLFESGRRFEKRFHFYNHYKYYTVIIPGGLNHERGFKGTAGKIDSIDAQLVDLFKQRMAVSRDIAAYKKEHSLPTLDAGRERALLAKVGTQAGEELAEYTESVFRSILAAGRSYQNQCSGVKSQVYETIRRALDTTPELFPQRAVVACQGIEGAYSQIACDSIFKSPPSCTSTPLNTCSRRWRPACASTASCPLRTAPPAR